mmetsp:Transcript_27613/g.42481  ORF Transcript_27613/g.42481 Transcript_27613/m.42481 type:complete len:246 (-) Transcript_27613:280-1017(-)
MMHSSNGRAEALIPIIILGGWSPGPLNQMKRFLQSRCVFIEPSIPTPPVGCSWCLDKSVLALAIVLIIMFWSSGRVFVAHGLQSMILRLATMGICVFLVRLCVAGIVRGSVAKGVRVVKRTLQQNRDNVKIVVGFSWGGGVVAELIRQGVVGSTPGQPSALLIAPTTALMSAVALQPDTALQVEVSSDSVHVFHGTHDKEFCPHADRWEQTGARVHWCEDNHLFLQRSSLQEIKRTMLHLLERQQ